MDHNPDLYTQGIRVKPSAEFIEQELGPRHASGKIVSRYPMHQIVTVKWRHKHTKERLHVDLLDLLNAASG